MKLMLFKASIGEGVRPTFTEQLLLQELYSLLLLHHLIEPPQQPPREAFGIQFE